MPIRTQEPTVERQPLQIEKLQAENEELRRRLEKAEETLRAIQQAAIAEAPARRSVESERGDAADWLERQQAEESEKRYRSLFDSIDEGFCVFEMIYDEAGEPVDYRFLQVNPAFEKHTGLVGAEGKTILELVPGQERHWFEIYGKVAATGEAVRFENRGEGMHRWFDVYAFREGGPEHRRVAAIFTDITERKRTEQALRTSEEKYRTLFESMDEGYCVIEFFDGPHGPLSDYVHVEANPAYAANTGIPNIVGQKVREMVPAEAAGWVEIYRNVLITGQPVRFERELVATGRHLELSAFRIGPAEQRRVAVLFKDITARKEAEAALRAAHTRLQKVLEIETVGVMFWDLTTGCMTDANDTFLNMMGYLRAEIAAGELTWQRLTPPEYVEASLAEIRKFQQSGRVGPYEKEYLRRDGTRQWLLFAGSSLGNNTCVEFCVDITERKHAEASLREADRRKNEFLAMLAHELRNPLAPIRNAAHVMRLTGDQSESVALAAEMMERQVSQMARLVDDLLDVSRLSRGKIELRKNRIELAPAIDQALEAARPQCENQGLELAVTLPSEPIVLDADQARLIQIVGNLLNNACKFTGRGGRVQLNVERHPREAVIRVRDNGIGIAPDQLSRIFDMFMQIDTSLERSTSGLGIGLTLVKNLVEMHDGAVEAYSDGIGQGSEFVVRLPIIVEPAIRPQRPTENMVKVTGRRILVVDDNQDSATSLALLLKLAGNETHMAFDGLEAVEAAANIHPDVVLLDLGLPKLNGYEACRRIRAQLADKKLRLIALTGWGQDEDRAKTRAAGFDAHMVKPVELDALMNYLGELDAPTA